ncbi:MAG: SIMPL domain-containing protein, partial [Jatrophihabitantaceae bacterium]
MTEPYEHTLISVRGQAERMVAADQASVHALVSAIADTKAAATALASQALDELLADLRALGGQTLTAANHRAPLTWSAQSIRTEDEYGTDPNTGAHSKTGRRVSTVNLVITVREFSLLGQLEASLTDRDPVDVQIIGWSVDEDNPAWALVRADAIRAALLKGQDYAAALDGTVTGVQQVADAGL